LYNNLADAGIESAVKQAQAIKDPVKAQEVFREAIKKTREKLEAPLKLAGVPQAEIDKIMASLDLDPALVEILLSGKSKEEMLLDIAKFRLEAEAAAGRISTVITADNAELYIALAEAEERLRGYETTTYSTPLDATTEPLHKKIAEGVTAGVGFSLNTFSAALDAGLDPFNAAIFTATLAGQTFARLIFAPGIDGEPSRFNRVMTTVNAALGALATMVVKPTIDVIGNAPAVIGAVLSGLNAIAGRVVGATVQVTREFIGGTGLPGSLIDGLFGRNGFIDTGQGFHPRFRPEVHRFANGGIERHVAQIARPGVVPRVWAERETGGEAYLPLAASKRPRSVAILKQVASMFGYQISKAQGYANGGTTGPVSNRNTTANVTIHNLNTNDPDAAVRKLRQAQRDALAVYGNH
jgi:hypothetical protein